MIQPCDRTQHFRKAMISLSSNPSPTAPLAQPSLSLLGMQTASLFVGLGLISAIALGSAGLAQRFAHQQTYQAVTGQQETTTARLGQRTEAYIDARRREIQSLSQLSLLSHRKIWSSLSPGEQSQALVQYVQVFDAYSTVALLDRQGSLTQTIRGSRDQANQLAVSPLTKRSLRQKNVVHGQSSETANALQLAAPIIDAATGEIIGSVVATIPQARMAKAIQGVDVLADSGFSADEGSRAIAFQMQRSLFLGLAFGLPSAALCLAALIGFQSQKIHQGLQLTATTLGKLGGQHIGG